MDPLPPRVVDPEPGPLGIKVVAATSAAVPARGSAVASEVPWVDRRPEGNRADPWSGGTIADPVAKFAASLPPMRARGWVRNGGQMLDDFAQPNDLVFCHATPGLGAVQLAEAIEYERRVGTSLP